jgi:hypothetical protein
LLSDRCLHITPKRSGGATIPTTRDWRRQPLFRSVPRNDNIVIGDLHQQLIFQGLSVRVCLLQQ